MCLESIAPCNLVFAGEVIQGLGGIANEPLPLLPEDDLPLNRRYLLL